jgi:hypothetical protein
MVTDANQTGPRILEIGAIPYLWNAFPDTTKFYSSWNDETFESPTHGRHIVSLACLPALRRHLADPSFDLVVVHAPPNSPWSGGAVVRAMFRRSVLHGNIPAFRGFGTELLRGRVAAPLVVLDLEDSTTIGRCNLFLLDKAALYFKRELPTDHWQVFATVHSRVPTSRFRGRERPRERIAKLRPISLGLPFSIAQKLSALPPPDCEKTIDVFFAGRVRNSSTVRQRGLEELLALRDEGYVIDVAEPTLPVGEYLARCSRAHLVWSPEGYGWQCFRTYEAAICGATALCSRQRIERYRPLVEGVHALYYDIEPGQLTRTVRAALENRDRLRAIGAAARKHVQTFHTPAAIAHYIVAEVAGSRMTCSIDTGCRW